METRTIGKLAAAAGVTVETIRYYESRGLIDQPPKPPQGFRRYSLDAVTRIQCIKRAQELGFTLTEVAELLDLRVHADSLCDEVREQAEAKITDIKEKIRTLQRMEQTLSDLVQSCEQRTPTGTCPILQALTSGKKDHAHH